MPAFMNLMDSVRARDQQTEEEEGRGRTAILGKSLSLSLEEQMAQVKGGSRGAMPPPQLSPASVV